TQTIDIRTRRTTPADTQESSRLGTLCMFAAVYTLALIVFGGIVRITGSGMGCGDDWPRCNGEWIPAFTLETLIEYTHRLLAAGIGIVVLAVFAYAFTHRRRPGVAGPGGSLRPLAIGGALLLVQIALGAITVRLELPPPVTVAHFITALLFMATLIVAAVRAGALGHPRQARSGIAAGASRQAWRMAAAAAALGLVVVSFGALTANTPAAPQACRGFPLCNGQLVPPASMPPAHVHWTHRVVAFLLFFHVLGANWAAARTQLGSTVHTAAVTTLGLLTLQLAVAAALVTLPLPPRLQALHLAIGAAIWFSLVTWAALARRDAEQLHSLP
ncbi:MAG: COX15/CtaA family protein, partial [Gammaproteobacteria bacterium]